MSILIGFVSLVLATILQSTLVIRFNLLKGAGDLVLLVLIAWMLHENTKAHWQWCVMAGFMIGFISEIPFWVTVFGYLLVMFLVHFLMKYVWQTPIMILFFITLAGSVIVLWLDFLYLVIFGANLPIWDTFNLVILPSVVLNLILVLPVYAVIGEVTKVVYPQVVEV